jgi:hypothetical protein
MIATSEEAALLIRGLQSERKPLIACLIARDGSYQFRLNGNIAEFVEGSHLVFEAHDARFILNLAGCEFNYTDPREAGESDREYARGRIEGHLAIRFASGDLAFVVELCRMAPDGREP